MAMGSASILAIRKSIASLVLVGAIAVICLNVGLILQNRRLKAEIVAPPGLVPKVGAKIEALKGIAVDGSKIQLPFTGQGKETLLFVFATNCGICTLNWPTWQSIARSIQGKPFQLVYADVMSPMSEHYVEEYHIAGARIFAQLDPEDEVALNLRLTPLTILLANNGEVEKVWVGLLDGQQLSDLKRRLGLANS
jgi:hypothetical protein